ncbi:MAG: M48 family metallopeptidase [Alphaproteobacteria bacterium]
MQAELSLPPAVKVTHSQRARRLALRLDPKERVVNLVVPRGVSLKKAEDFAKFHETWIKKAMMELPPPMPFEHGRVIPVLGRDRLIQVYVDKTRLTTEIKLKVNKLEIYTNKADPSARIERFLKELAKEKISELARAKAVHINKKIPRITIRDTKSRWGSCSEDGKLSFSWRLIFAPLKAMDYVIAHEVAHLVHLNHGKRFWTLCRELSRDFIEGEYWMRNHGHELMRYGQKARRRTSLT